MRRNHRTSGRRAMLLSIVPIALGIAAILGAQAGQVTGKVIDEDGKPVSNLVIQFTSVEDEGASRNVEVRKKGRFAESRLPHGRYRITLVDSDLFVASAAFELRRGDGLSQGSGLIEGHPRDGGFGVPVSPRDELLLTLTVSQKGAATGEGELTIESPELSGAVKLYNRAKYEDAIEEAARVLAENPESGEAIYLQGLSAAKLGRPVEAESALQQAVARIPELPGIWATLGDVSLSLATDHETNGREEEAKQAYGRAAEALSKAVEDEPESLSLQVDLAVSLDRIGDHDRLRTLLERIVELDPMHAQSRLRLAALYSNDGRHEEAMALLNELPATETRAAVTIYNIAVGLNDAGDADGALLAARRSAEIDPEMSHSKRLIAQILLGKGDHAAAILAIRAFLEIAPDDPEAEAYRRILEQLEE